VQETRRVYFALDNDTPLDIAEKFDVPVGKIVYDNRKNYNSLKETSLLKLLTAIVLPLKDFDTNEYDGSRSASAVRG
jgi:hypothetical protein